MNQDTPNASPNTENAQIAKVTAFITRPGTQEIELLVFQHPQAGVQLPAGTVEPGEAPEDAVLREVEEETGLSTVVLVGLLAVIPQAFAPDEYMLIEPIALRTAPSVDAPKMRFLLQRGLRVRIREKKGDFVRAIYEEYDMRDNELAVSTRRVGWLPVSALTKKVPRYLYHLRLSALAPDEWTLTSDNGLLYKPFWIPVTRRNFIVAPQEAWLNAVREQLLASGNPSSE